MNEPPYLIPPYVPQVSRMPARESARRYERQLADMAAHGAPRSELEIMRSTFDAMVYATRLMEDHSPGELRRRAHVVMRCDDCRGRAIGWIVNVDGEPVFMGERRDGMVVVLMLNARGFAWPTFRCPRSTYRLSAEMIDERNAEVRLRHAQAVVQ